MKIAGGRRDFDGSGNETGTLLLRAPATVIAEKYLARMETAGQPITGFPIISARIVGEHSSGGHDIAAHLEPG